MKQAKRIVARSHSRDCGGIRGSAIELDDGRWLVTQWYPSGGREQTCVESRSEAIAALRRMKYPCMRIYATA